LQQEKEQVLQVAWTVARGTEVRAEALVEWAMELPDRILEAANGLEFTADNLAHRLAEAGILPMFGMPTNVRELYFALPKDEDEPKSLDRPFDQAITDFAPGAERTWDKRRLSPVGLSGTVNKHHGRWKVSGSPSGAAYLQVSCAACRQLHVYPANPVTLEPLAASRLWRPEWLTSPPAGLDCPSCGATGAAKAYIGVVPNAFITDLDDGKGASGRGEGRGRSGYAPVAAPSLSGVDFLPVANCEIAIGKQKPVYRVNSNGGQLFGFSNIDALQADAPRGAWLRAGTEGEIWKATEDRPARRVALVSPKTTDVLAVRLSDGAGLAFFDDPLAVNPVSRRAAWYSAATILLRAIALKHDVDSTEIEIASVHGLPQLGAELYLADAHPNGAGLVDWAHDHWRLLLEECVLGTGGTGTLGWLIREELKRSLTEEWRTPDLLLRGFRNRSLHGLLDWRLGIELLAVMLDQEFRPGLDLLVNGAALPTGKDGSWADIARMQAQHYVSAFREAQALTGAELVSGWIEKDILHVIVHPLWAGYQGPKNAMAEAYELAKHIGAKGLRRIDSFNLARRMTWVRANPDFFPSESLDGTPPQTFQGGPNAGADVKPGEIRNMSDGALFSALGKEWQRVADTQAITAPAGTWLAIFNTGEVGLVQLKQQPGMPSPRARRPGGAGWLPIETLMLLARAAGEQEGGAA
jgi:hypothetical protein